MDTWVWALLFLIICGCCCLVSSLVGGAATWWFWTEDDTATSNGTSNGDGTNGTNGTSATAETCGYPEGEKEIPQIQGNEKLTGIIGFTAAKYFELPGLPGAGIKLKNWQLANWTVDVWIDGKDMGCKTLDFTPDDKVIVRKAYNGIDYTYSFENGAVHIDTGTGKHQVTGL